MDSTSADNIREDAVSKVLGRDKPGRVRGLGRGITATKLAFLQARDSRLEELQSEVRDLKSLVRDLAGKKVSLLILYLAIMNHQMNITYYMLLPLVRNVGIRLLNLALAMLAKELYVSFWIGFRLKILLSEKENFALLNQITRLAVFQLVLTPPLLSSIL